MIKVHDFRILYDRAFILLHYLSGRKRVFEVTDVMRGDDYHIKVIDLDQEKRNQMRFSIILNSDILKDSGVIIEIISAETHPEHFI